MSLLNEMYGGGLDNFDRAVEMINSAVEHHDRNDNFDAIADIDGLVQFLKGQYHDFTPELESTVREIIADEMSGEPAAEEQEEDNWHKKGEFPSLKARAKDPWLVNKLQNQGMSNYYGAKMKDRHRDKMVKAAKSEEEETFTDRIERMRRENKAVLDDSRKRRMARKYGVSGPSSRRSRVGSRAQGRMTSRSEQEEVVSLSDRRTKRDRFNPDIRRNRRGHRHSDPMRRRAQLMARKARPHVGTEEEEHKTNYDMQVQDWNKEVEEFRKRRKTYEPEYARGHSRLMKRRRPSGPSGNAFGVRFESFSQFNEMYRDSQHGLTIDLSGPEGNAFVLIGHAKNLAKQIGLDTDAILEDMKSGDYDHLVDVFDKHFGSVVTLINKPGEDDYDYDGDHI